MDDLYCCSIDVLPKAIVGVTPFKKERKKYAALYPCWDIKRSDDLYRDQHQSLSLACPFFIDELIVMLLSDIGYYNLDVELELVNEYLDEIYARALDYLITVCSDSPASVFDTHLNEQCWQDSLYNLSIVVMWSVLNNLYHMGITGGVNQKLWLDFERGYFSRENHYIVYYLEGI